MNYTQDEVENVMRIVDTVVNSRWRDDPDLDDIRAEGYYWAWKGYLQAREQRRYQPTTRAFHCARQARVSWLRRWLGRGTDLSLREGMLLLDDYRRESDDEDEADLTPRDRDFTPGVLARIEWQEWLALLTPKQRWVMRRRFEDDWTPSECARTLGLTQSAVWWLELRAIRTIRHCLGLPDPEVYRRARSRHQRRRKEKV